MYSFHTYRILTPFPLFSGAFDSSWCNIRLLSIVRLESNQFGRFSRTLLSPPSAVLRPLAVFVLISSVVCRLFNRYHTYLSPETECTILAKLLFYRATRGIGTLWQVAVDQYDSAFRPMTQIDYTLAHGARSGPRTTRRYIAHRRAALLASPTRARAS